MYFVKYGTEYLHDPRIDLFVTDAVVECELNTSGTFEFALTSKHPMFDVIREHDIKHEVTVYDDDELLFCGTVIEINKDFQLTSKVTCRGELSYLNDSIVLPYSTIETEYGTTVPNSGSSYFEWLIEQHNAQVDRYRQFTVGRNEGYTLDGHIYRSDSTYPNTGSVIRDKILDGFGGYITVTHEDGKRVINLQNDFDPVNAQVIDFGINLLDFTDDEASDDVVTFVIPLGAAMKDTQYSYTDGYFKTKDTTPVKTKTYYSVSNDDTDGTKTKCEKLTKFESGKTYYEYNAHNDESEKKLGIEDYPDGEISDGYMVRGDRIVCIEAEEKYGCIGSVYEDNDLTLVENVAMNGLRYLQGAITPIRSIEIKAIDLSMIKPDYEPISVGQYIRVRSKPHGVDSYFLCCKISININQPDNNTFTLGNTYDTLTGQSNRRINALNGTINTVYEATSAISADAKLAADTAAAANGKAEEAKDTAITAQSTATSAEEKADSALEQIANLNGKFLYIRYSANADGSNFTDAPTASTKYMGIYSGDSETAPQNASDYVWTLIKGNDGVGVKGADGQPAYLHIKYSDDGTTFTANGGETAGAWLGTYSDHTEADSTKFSDYTWAKVKGERGEQGLRGLQGERGEQGIPGSAGEDGKSSYFHVKYSPVESPTASQMTEDTNTYIGTYVDYTEADSNDPTKYKWVRLEGLQGEKGDQGIPGVGVDGKTSYLHIKYSNDNGATFTGNSGETVGTYIGTCTDFNANDPTTVGSYKWALIKGADGSDGEQGVSCTAVVEQYYLSTSNTAQSGGSWVTTCPAWVSGKYIWSRSEVTWSDDGVTHTEPVLANALNTANSTAADASDTANAAQQVASDAQTGVDNIIAGKPLLTTWAGDGLDGYVYIGDITYSGSWLNQPIKLNISQRGISSYNVIFRWENTDGDQSIETLTTSRKGTSVVAVQWDYQHASLYVLKSESYDSVSVMKVENVYEPTGVQVILSSDDEIYQLADLQSYSTVGVVVSSVDEECATNYMEFVDGEGLVVGNMTDETLGKNTLIDADGMAIRDGETELARFESDEVQLGMNSNTSIIDLCNGSGIITGASNNGGLVIQSNSVGNVDGASIMVESEFILKSDNGASIKIGRDKISLSASDRVDVFGEVDLDQPLPLDSGGTGATTAEQARINLGITSAGTVGEITPDDINGVLGIDKGGTGATTAAAARTNLGFGVAYYNIASLVTVSSGITITAASIRVVNGQIAFLSIGFKKATATTANTQFNVCTLGSKILHSIALLNMGVAGFADALASGQIRAKPAIAYSANTQMYVSGVYLLANEYRG